MSMDDCSKYPAGSRRRAICDGTANLSPRVLKSQQEALKREPSKARRLEPGERPAFDFHAVAAGGLFASVAAPAETYGPGSELIKIFTARGVPSCQACRDLAAKMDREGPAWCRENLEVLVEDILPRARDWVATNMPWAHRLLPGKLEEFGIRLRVRGYLTEAIENAEANQAPPEPVKKNSAQLAVSIAARTAVRAGQAARRDPPPPFNGPITRHLIYHLYPAKHTDQWKWNLDQILQRIDVFNGQRILGLAIDRTTVSAQEVRDYVGDRFTEIVEVANNKKRGELTTFEKMMTRVQATDPNAIVFYAHGKGTTASPDGKTTSGGKLPDMRRWTDAMYRGCLDDIAEVEAALNDHVFAGGFRRKKGNGRWYFSGTFFWFRASAVFSRKWQLKGTQRWAVEFWPATITKFEDNACLFGDNAGSLYDPKQLTRALSAMDPAPEPIVSPAATTPGVCLVTCTGDRPEAFALCERWMQRQTYTGPLQWIVVDDGSIPTKVSAGQEYYRRQPRRGEGHTLPKNLQVALPHVRHDKVLFIEDDDWYAPNYVEQMSQWLDAEPLVGAGFARYYWPRQARFREFPDHRHGSLCRTGLRRELFPVLQKCLNGNQSVDLRLWAAVQGRRYDDQILCISPKGMPGRPSGGGDPDSGSPDPDLSQLRKWIGDDFEHYRPMLPKVVRPRDERVVVYTVVLGRYDKIRPPAVTNPNVRYVAITDGTAPAPWEVMQPPASLLSRKHQTRHLKLMAHELFPDADWTIYYDGQLQLAVDPLALLAECEAWGDGDLYLFRHQDRDCIYREAEEVARIGKDRAANVRPQVERYRAAGFPEAAGLYLGGMLIRRRGCEAFNAMWWGEVASASHRDQISLPVALERSGVRFVPLPAMWWTHFFLRHPHNGMTRASTLRGRASVLHR